MFHCHCIVRRLCNCTHLFASHQWIYIRVNYGNSKMGFLLDFVLICCYFDTFMWVLSTTSRLSARHSFLVYTLTHADTLLSGSAIAEINFLLQISNFQNVREWQRGLTSPQASNNSFELSNSIIGFHITHPSLPKLWGWL